MWPRCPWLLSRVTVGLGSAEVEEDRALGHSGCGGMASREKVRRRLGPNSTEHPLWGSAAKASRETGLELSGRAKSKEGFCFLQPRRNN